MKHSGLQRSFSGSHLAVLVSICLITVGSALLAPVVACPFCSAVSQTFAEEIGSLDAAVLVKLTMHGKADPNDEDDDGYTATPRSEFEVIEVLKGEAHVKVGERIKTHFFGKPHGGTFIVMGTDCPDTIWTSPLALSEDGVAYIKKVVTLPADATRLQFFQNYLEDSDEMLARDAYDEFANAPYSDVIALKPHMDRESILGWIKATDTVPASRRRLYLTMLGVCGEKSDAKLLEGYMRSDDREAKLGMDAMIACYLTLLGPDGMETIKELFLANKDSEYADTYSAIMALRFHAGNTEVLPKEKILDGFHCLLERPDLADLVIPDLARWEDWSIMPRLLELFKDADAESNWIRVPIVNYVRACPLEEADELMDKLKEIDPAAVKRASTFFPIAPKGKQPVQSSKLDNFPGDGEEQYALAGGTEETFTPPSRPPEVGQLDELTPAAGTVTHEEVEDLFARDAKKRRVWPAVVGLIALGAIGRALVGSRN